MKIELKTCLKVLGTLALMAVGNVSAQAAEPITHSIFIAGPNFTGIMDEAGNAAWDAGEKGARDGYILPGGNALIAWSKEVRELTRDHRVVFRYQLSADNQEIGTVQRLDNGHTLITELGKKPRLMEVTPQVKWLSMFHCSPRRITRTCKRGWLASCLTATIWFRIC